MSDVGAQGRAVLTAYLDERLDAGGVVDVYVDDGVDPADLAASVVHAAALAVLEASAACGVAPGELLARSALRAEGVA
ncbi:hypothetical protein [Intrasporangium sp.]|uniref:hypothetical protein n=1 Tax=Intrasporangium sp. TaxID=1925024 RepID=UPI003221A228